MPTDQNEHQVVGPEHQPPPAHQHKGVRALVWIVLLLVFGAGFFWVLRHHDDTTKAAKSPKGGGGAATVTTATAQKGDIGVYLDSIGTVTPVYTASITSQVNGTVIAVHFTEGQIVRKGDPLIDIDPRPYQATLSAGAGNAGAGSGHSGAGEDGSRPLSRRLGRGTRFRSRRWTIRRRSCCRTQGTVKNDQGTVQFDQVQLELLPHYRSDLRQSWSAAGRSGQRGAVVGDADAGGDHAVAADHGDLHDS